MLIENALDDEESGVFGEPVDTEGFRLGGAAEIGDLNHVCACLSSLDTTNVPGRRLGTNPTWRLTSSVRMTCAPEGW